VIRHHATHDRSGDSSWRHDAYFGAMTQCLKKNVYVAVSNPAVLIKVPASTMDSFNKKPLDLPIGACWM